MKLRIYFNSKGLQSTFTFDNPKDANIHEGFLQITSKDDEMYSFNSDTVIQVITTKIGDEKDA